MAELGRTIGAYEVLRQLGEGGMAAVYLARQPALGRLVALKELRMVRPSPQLAARFVRESRLAGSLSHPNIVTVLDFLEDGGIPYIAMEYLEHGSLRPFLPRLTMPQIAGVFEGLLAGLAHAEARGIVHRDLKPENLLVSETGGIKIADFGIAKALAPIAGLASLNTDPGMAIGTPAYMAPEQARGEQVGPWTDLYAVGVIAYELFTGRQPYEPATPIVMMLRHINDPIQPASSVTPGLDGDISAWIDRLLRKAPEERTPSATVAWQELEEILEQNGLVPEYWRRAAALLPAVSVASEDRTPDSEPDEAQAGGHNARAGQEAAHTTRKAQAPPPVAADEPVSPVEDTPRHGAHAGSRHAAAELSGTPIPGASSVEVVGATPPRVEPPPRPVNREVGEVPPTSPAPVSGARAPHSRASPAAEPDMPADAKPAAEEEEARTTAPGEAPPSTPEPRSLPAPGTDTVAVRAGGSRGVPERSLGIPRIRTFALLLVAVASVAAAVVLLAGSGNKAKPTRSPARGSHQPATASPTPSSVTVAVLNGTTDLGLARNVAEGLGAAGYALGTVATGPTTSQRSTVVGYLAGHKADAVGVASTLKLNRAVIAPVSSESAAVACPSSHCRSTVVVTAGADLLAGYGGVDYTPSSVNLRLVPTGLVFVCLTDGAGHKLIDGNFSPAQTIPSKSGSLLLLTLGSNLVHMTVNGAAVRIPQSAEAISYRLTPAGAQRIAAPSGPTCS